MFANAYELASNFTHPVIISSRFFDNSVKCGCAAYIVINDEGWIITVAHLWDSQFESMKHKNLMSDYEEQVQIIQQNQKMNSKQKIKKVKQLKANPKWIINHSFWWGDGVELKDIKPLPEGDLLVGRLDPFDPKMIKSYPVFKDPTNLRIGTSLCKLGFPFYEIEATFKEDTETFKLAPGTLPLPLFPIEGIYTRNLIYGKSKNGKYNLKFLETSSPGLRGQSGGPIFDVRGTIWAIQSKTFHFELGFSPKVEKKGREIEENQFLNVGIGVHPSLIVQFLRDNSIKFDISDY
jgi:hypothetical protein